MPTAALPVHVDTALWPCDYQHAYALVSCQPGCACRITSWIMQVGVLSRSGLPSSEETSHPRSSNTKPVFSPSCVFGWGRAARSSIADYSSKPRYLACSGLDLEGNVRCRLGWFSSSPQVDVSGWEPGAFVPPCRHASACILQACTKLKPHFSLVVFPRHSPIPSFSIR